MDSVQQQSSTSQGEKCRKRKHEEESDFDQSMDDSNDSDFSLLSGFQAKKNYRKVGGCNVTLNRRDGIYTWKSERFPSYNYFIDVKIWSPAKSSKGEPLEAWKDATFRAKLAFGNPMVKESKQNADDFVKELKRFITTQADSFERVEKLFEPCKYKKK